MTSIAERKFVTGYTLHPQHLKQLAQLPQFWGLTVNIGQLLLPNCTSIPQAGLCVGISA
jgi:hypothetical protein